MLNNKKIVVVMPAYNAESTLEQTHFDICKEIVDDIILIDDASTDNTKLISEKLNITTILHSENKGYGANQKSCYIAALQAGADIIIMLHPDYQYTPKLVPAMAAMLAFGEYEIVIASRMLTGSALKGGMPLYKWISNKFLTAFQNFFNGEHLSEYHTGFRGFTKEVFDKIPIEDFDDDFIFDNQFLALSVYHKFKIGEISCPTKYFPEASSINFVRSCKYGLGVLQNSLLYFLAHSGIYKSKIYSRNARKLDINKELNYFYRKK